MRALLTAALALSTFATATVLPCRHHSHSPLFGTRGLRGGSSDADGIEAIDFAAAWQAAREAQRAGASREQALANADLALAGSVPFSVLPLPAEGGFIAKGWLEEMEAKIRLHEVVTEEGWEEGPEGRTLTLKNPLPVWCNELGAKLARALGGPPDSCIGRALEQGQSVPARSLRYGEDLELTPQNEEACSVACLCLAGPGLLTCSSNGQTEVVKIEVGSCMLLRDEALRALSIRVLAAERHHILLIFRRTTGSALVEPREVP